MEKVQISGQHDRELQVLATLESNIDYNKDADTLMEFLSLGIPSGTVELAIVRFVEELADVMESKNLRSLRRALEGVEGLTLD